jgi:acetyl esterase
MDWFWAHYMSGSETVTAGAAPLRATNLKDCPPTLVMTAEYDVLRDEGEELAARLFREGVLVTGRRYAGVNHNFIAFSEVLPQAGVAMADLCAWIRSCAADCSNVVDKVN